MTTVNTSCHSFVIRAAARKITGYYDDALSNLGMSAEQWSLLSLLAEKGPLSISCLAAEAYLERSTVGRNVKVLNSKGWTESSNDRADGRLSIIVLTPEGLRVSQEAQIVWARCQKEVEHVLGVEPLASLRIVLTSPL